MLVVSVAADVGDIGGPLLPTGSVPTLSTMQIASLPLRMGPRNTPIAWATAGILPVGLARARCDPPNSRSLPSMVFVGFTFSVMR